MFNCWEYESRFILYGEILLSMGILTKIDINYTVRMIQNCSTIVDQLLNDYFNLGLYVLDHKVSISEHRSHIPRDIFSREKNVETTLCTSRTNK